MHVWWWWCGHELGGTACMRMRLQPEKIQLAAPLVRVLAP
jgi:hypothetical protein